MAGPIQQIPQGLLGLLQLKELGSNPPTLVDTVAPNLDLFALYAERGSNAALGLFGVNPQTATFATATPNVHNFLVGGVNAQVPQNEMWYVTNAGITMVGLIAAADSITVGLGWLSFAGAGGDLYMMTPVYRDTITPRSRFLQTDPMPRPMFVAPGGIFTAVVVDNLTAGTQQLQLSIRAIRIPI